MTRRKPKGVLVGAAFDAARYRCGARELKRLLDAGVSVNARDYDGWTLLMTASTYGNASVVRFLIGRGAHLNARDSSSWKTALHAAAYNRELEVMAILKKAGANARLKDRNGLTADDYLKPSQ